MYQISIKGELIYIYISYIPYLSGLLVSQHKALRLEDVMDEEGEGGQFWADMDVKRGESF
jgi:hypothetical protein